MEAIGIIGALGLVGVCMGSFAGAAVWRLRARQLVEDKAASEPVDGTEYKRLLPLTRYKGMKDRSRCLRCGHQLAWYDLIPLLSWLRTGGRCRYCQASIGWFEPTMELTMAAVFIGSYFLWPVAIDTTAAIIQFGLWLVCMVLLLILFAYDLKWSLLPDRVVFPLIAVAALVALIGVLMSTDVTSDLLNLGGAVLILSGLYLLLYLVSRGAWIGFGDVKLGLALGLLLADWRLAFIGLFLANLIGCIVVIPGLVGGKLSRTSPVPFGPMLIVGFLLAFFFGSGLANWYMSWLV